MSENLATADIVIVGAGIVGLCTAWELQKCGFNVVVVEQRFIGFGATSRNPGAVWLQTRRAGIELELARAGAAKYQEYRGYLGDVFAFGTRGGVVFSEEPDSLDSLTAYAEERDAAGLDVEVLAGEQLRRQSAIMPETATAGVLCRDDSQIDSLRFVTALAAACVERGVQIFENTAVLATLRTADQVNGVQTVRGKISAGGIVWATGAWATNLKLEGVTIPMRTLRLGQVMTQAVDKHHSPLLHGLRGTFGAGALEPLANATGEGGLASGSLVGYDDTIVQNRGGAVYIGHSVDGQDSLNPHITIDASRRMLDTVGDRYPKLGAYGVTGLWAGLSCQTEDDLPIVDRDGGVFFNVGHAWGAASAPICGQLTADLVTGDLNSLTGSLAFHRSSLVGL